MEWSEFVEAAKSTSWITYLGTADSEGIPHVAAVAPGFAPGAVWFATNRGSKKLRNLQLNPAVAFHWPVGSGGVGEVAAWGNAGLYASQGDRERIWAAGIFEYDLGQFFGSPGNAELVFVEASIDRARLVGPDFAISRYRGR